ncbi:hypothetical protein [Cupriavidus agavae]|uniref:Uncharacterized protein n=1 Tax=Cupriavidus agavae TaxID=1001822 RepID=A0A4Q7RV51_9BURK|nr:hypothetical protein [Cupriavidus agavae]RZT36312.1 hypothetical protein EV147_3631 [Cupriavidus agavae]
MRNKFSKERGADERSQTLLHTAQAQANALHGMYRDTLAAFMEAPNAVPVPRAARAMFWLGRLRQWRAIDLGTGAPETSWLSLHLGVVESLAGTHALALHRDQWSGPSRRHTYERDMSLQVAMLLALGWNELAAFALQSWFGVEKALAHQNPLNGMTGMIVGVAGQALDVSVPVTSFQRSDALLASIVEAWQADDTRFLPLANALAERHMVQCRLDTDQSLFDFDHPVEQAMPVELLMLLRLRGVTEMPPWLSHHAALAHPAAVLVQTSPPVQSQRCAAFIERASLLLPQYRGLTDALSRQVNVLQPASA